MKKRFMRVVVQYDFHLVIYEERLNQFTKFAQRRHKLWKQYNIKMNCVYSVQKVIYIENCQNGPWKYLLLSSTTYLREAGFSTLSDVKKIWILSRHKPRLAINIVKNESRRWELSFQIISTISLVFLRIRTELLAQFLNVIT